MLQTFHRLRKQRLSLSLVWDAFMVYLAFVNVSLIVFDLSYLWLRPYYLRYLPVVTRMYDPVKGIGSDPGSTQLLEKVDELRLKIDEWGDEAEFLPLHLEVVDRSIVMVEGETFERSGQTQSAKAIEAVVDQTLGYPSAELSAQMKTAMFWSGDPVTIRERIEVFDRHIAPLMRLNYHRAYDLNGELYDRFWLIDLPFWTFFFLEFLVRWGLALRRRTYARWFIFPVVNWYDLLAIIPGRQMRLFRLFRIVSIYVRLHRSELTNVGEDMVSRTVKYFANIIAEEISDNVAIRILSMAQSEIRLGVHEEIFRGVLEPRRAQLKDRMVESLCSTIASPRLQEKSRDFLSLNLEISVEKGGAFDRVPLPNAVLRPLVHGIGEVVYDSVIETLTTTLTSPEGRELLGEIVDGLLDTLGPDGSGDVELFVRDLALDALERVKEAVAVKKWALSREESSRPTRG